MDLKLIMWIVMCVTVIAFLLRILRCPAKINLPASIIFSVSVSFLLNSISSYHWFADYIWAIILLAGLVTIIFVMARPAKKTSKPLGDENY
jgi:hypothetical protein